MKTYNETKLAIDNIRNRKNEMLFRMSISHILDVGMRLLTEENVEETCAEIMAHDDSKLFMSNEWLCAIVRTAKEIVDAVDNHCHLLVYIQNELEYDCGQKEMIRSNLVKVAQNMAHRILNDNDGLDSGDLKDIFLDEIELDEENFEELGIGYLNEIVDN